MDPPPQFICPITSDVMRDPVMVVATSQVYDRASIEGWFAKGKSTDPITNVLLSDKTLVPVRSLRDLIEQWAEEQKKKLLSGIEGLDDSIPQIAQDRLVLGETLHSGSLATVSSAILQPKGQEVVVKMFRAQGLTEDDSAKFRKEVTTLHQASMLCHNVCRLLGVANIRGQLCMVMPRYPASLEQVLHQHQQSLQSSSNGSASRGLPLDRTLGICVDIASAIVDLHEWKFLILDLKPANILLDKYGRAVLADFGISALCNSTIACYMPTSVQGSPNYMAPEQWLPDDFGGITRAADAWAFGCVLVEMATGKAPWAGLKMQDIMERVTAPQKQSPAIPDSLPAPLVGLLRRCLSYQPADRPPFEEILTVLQQAVAAAGAGPSSPISPIPAEPRPEETANTLLLAVKDGDLPMVQYLVQAEGMSLDAKDGDGRNAAHLAAKGGSLGLIKYLVEEQGMSLDAKDKDGCDALHLAAQGGHLELVQYLINNTGMPLDVKNRDGKTPLDFAELAGKADVARFLRDPKQPDAQASGDFDFRAICDAARRGDLDRVRFLADKVGDLDTCCDQFGLNALHHAARSGRLEVVMYLVERRGMSVNTQGRLGDKPIHRAAIDGQIEVVKYFLEDQEMDMYEKGCLMQNVLHYAAGENHLELVKYLVERKQMDLNIKDDCDKTPLDRAEENKHADVVSYLRQAGG